MGVGPAPPGHRRGLGWDAIEFLGNLPSESSVPPTDRRDLGPDGGAEAAPDHDTMSRPVMPASLWPGTSQYTW